MDAPIAGHSPRLDHVVRALHAVRLVIIRRLMKVLRELAASRLHLAEFVRAARLQHTFLAVPLPVQPKAGVGLRMYLSAKLGLFPRLPAIHGYFYFAHLAAARPCQPAA